MNRRPITLADARAEGRDPLAILGPDRALLLDGAWLARVNAGAPLMFWDREDDEEGTPTGYTRSVGGVAVVEVDGPIAQRGWFCIDGYDTICANLEAALSDTAVRTVLLRVNSPGGAAAGAFEWTRRMRDLATASGKRVVAYADEMMCSGAYAIACAADEIVTPETGFVGSVGVIASMVSLARANDAEGVDVRVLTTGAEKADGHPDLPMDEAAVARAQAEVDQLGAVFHRWVAERRRMSVDAVRALEAGVRLGAEAVAAGLADRVLGYHALLAELEAAASAAPSPRAPARTPGASRASSTRGSTMLTEQTLAALAALTGETDPDKAVTSLLARARDAEKTAADLATARTTVERLSADLATAVTRASDAEKRIETIERDGELNAAKAAGQWSASLEPFLATLSVEQLRTWRANAPRVVPVDEVKPPVSRAAPEGALPAKVASAVEKARASGWASLSGREKHTVTAFSKELAAELQAPRS